MGKGGRETSPLLLAQFRPAWAAQAYLRFCRIKHHVENWTHPFSASGGSLPQLHSKDSIVPDREIIRFLKANFVNLDSNLSDAQVGQSVAFESLVRNDLTVALEWSRWADDEHFYKVTRKRLLAAVPFPLNYGWTWYERKAVLFRLGHHHNISDEESAKLVAAKAYKALGDQLGDKDWFFGAGPTSLDCVVFGHLMDALREPIGVLLLHHHQNLVSFCQRIQRTLFDEPTQEIVQCSTTSWTPNLFSNSEGFNAVYQPGALDFSSWGNVDENGEEKPKEEEEEMSLREKEFKEGSRNAILFAGGVVVAYLLFSNVISFRYLASDDDEDEDEELD